jgi:hypothetical protein
MVQQPPLKHCTTLCKFRCVIKHYYLDLHWICASYLPEQDYDSFGFGELLPRRLNLIITQERSSTASIISLLQLQQAKYSVPSRQI